MKYDYEVIKDEEDTYDKERWIKYRGYEIHENASRGDDCTYYSTDVYKDGKEIAHFNREWIQHGIDYVDRILGENKMEENKIIEHRIVYNDYNFQNIKKFVACKSCQYYEKEKCMNKYDCFWLDLERKLKALEVIKNKRVNVDDLVGYCFNLKDNYNEYVYLFDYVDKCWDLGRELLTQDEYDLLKEVLL